MSPFPGGKQVARARNSSTAEAGRAILGVAVESSHLSICGLLQAPTMRLRDYERLQVSILLLISFTSAFVSLTSAFVSFTSAFVSFTSAFVSFASNEKRFQD